MLNGWKGFDVVALDLVRSEFRRALNQSSDPRVGSARDNATSTTILRVPSGTNSPSGFGLLMTLAPILIYTAVCLLIFLALRRKYPRVYAPRTFLSDLHPHERSAELPSGWFNWIKPFYQVPDSYILNHSSLDGFLFLRYIKVLIIIVGVGCCITWPVLIPLHVHGGHDGIQLNALTFGNVAHPSWYYAHAFLAWIYFGFILYMVNRECIYFINLRQAYLLSPFYASRISSRTVLFTCVPRQYLSESKLRTLFEDTVKNVWIPRDVEDLDRLVKERGQTADRLEKAEIVLMKKANAARNAALKKNPSDILRSIKRGSNADEKDSVGTSLFRRMTRKNQDQITGFTLSPIEPEAKDEQTKLSVSSPLSQASTQADFLPNESLEQKSESNGSSDYGFSHLPDVNGSVASQWIPHENRPTHRPLANMGKSVDTIKWTRNRLNQLRTQIKKARRKYRMGIPTPIPAAFIEFHTQADAQAAYQTLAHQRPFHMNPVNVGLRPCEISWPTLTLTWWERIVRKFAMKGFITCCCIFWSIPCAIVGIVSNVSFLTTKVPFLHWISLLPSPILGLISGLVPAIALHLLMAAVPGLMRVCARVSGVPTLSLVELFAQNAYFVFLVIQVFIVTTLTSAASASLSAILDNPASARTLLAQSIPKASNFYISFFILQSLGVSANRIVHMLSFFRLQVSLKNLASPRILSIRYYRLRKIHWGSIFPMFTNMGVIAITYSIIAPIILGFAAVGLVFVYSVYKYNLLYVYSNENDTRGLHYPRALKQTITGLYLAEVCMIGLLSVGGGFGPAFLMIVLFIFTILIHMSLSDALGPLLYNIPRTLAMEEERRQNGHPIPESSEADIQFIFRTDLPNIEDMEDGVDPDYMHPSEQLAADAAAFDGPTGTRAVEGAEEAASLGTKIIGDLIQGKIRSNVTSHPTYTHVMKQINFWSYWTSPEPSTKPNFLVKWLHPEIFEDYSMLRQLIPHDLPIAQYPEDMGRHAYDPPSMSEPEPRLWIPRDMAGVSRQEVVHSGKVVPITDEGAFLNENNRLEVDLSVFHPVLPERLPY